jgi:GH25 family lysozyme M1 (1,4-beta-N-acetylmuramidase)
MPIVPNIADFNHNNPVNFSEIVASGIWATIHKATQGIGFKDPAYTKRMAAAKGLGLLWAAYDFATGDNVASNVAAFLAAAQLGPNDGAWLDFEDNSASNMTGDQAYDFLDRVSQKLGRACGIYGGNRIREQIDHQDPKWIDMARTAPLWQCRYIKAQPADNADLFRLITPIPPWTRNTIIQYTGDGVGPKPHTVNGLESGADLDVYNGGRDELVKIWAGAPRPGLA